MALESGMLAKGAPLPSLIPRPVSRYGRVSLSYLAADTEVGGIVHRPICVPLNRSR